MYKNESTLNYKKILIMFHYLICCKLTFDLQRNNLHINIEHTLLQIHISKFL
jgi:hypothetical protein